MQGISKATRKDGYWCGALIAAGVIAFAFYVHEFRAGMGHEAGTYKAGQCYYLSWFGSGALFGAGIGAPFRLKIVGAVLGVPAIYFLTVFFVLLSGGMF